MAQASYHAHVSRSPRCGHKTWISLHLPMPSDQRAVRSTEDVQASSPVQRSSVDAINTRPWVARSHGLGSGPLSHVKAVRCLRLTPPFPRQHTSSPHLSPTEHAQHHFNGCTPTARVDSSTSSDQLTYLEFGCSASDIVP